MDTDRLSKYLQSLQTEHPFSGCISVTCRGENVFSRCFGLADEWSQEPITRSTRFRIASLTKQFTACAALMTFEDQAIDLGTKLAEFYPRFIRADEITLEDLLLHTSGIQSYHVLPDYDELTRSPVEPEALIERFRDLPLAFTPGEKFQYGNTGYLLIGRILERLHRKPLDDIYRGLIFDPLGLPDTALDVGTTFPPGQARGYRLVDGQVQDADPMNMTMFHAAGGLYSTIDDLDTWSRHFHASKFPSATVRERLFGHFIETGAAYRSGFGLVTEVRNDRQLFYLGGGIPGFSAICMHAPADAIGVNILTNFPVHPIDPLASTLIDLVATG